MGLGIWDFWDSIPGVPRTAPVTFPREIPTQLRRGGKFTIPTFPHPSPSRLGSFNLNPRRFSPNPPFLAHTPVSTRRPFLLTPSFLPTPSLCTTCATESGRRVRAQASASVTAPNFHCPGCARRMSRLSWISPSSSRGPSTCEGTRRSSPAWTSHLRHQPPRGPHPSCPRAAGVLFGLPA